MNLIKSMLGWLFSLEGTKAGKLILPDRLHCGGVVRVHTMTQAQKYLVNWKPIVASFPILKEFRNFDLGWGHLVDNVMGAQGINDPEMWAFIDRFRTPDGRVRRVKDKVMTTAFVDFVVDQLQAETSVFGDFKYHDSGTGAVAENITDTQMGNDSGEARSTGTQTETDHDTYKSVATDTYAGTFAITEHGLFNLDTLGAGTLMDRTVFAAINVVSGNQIEFTFEGSFTAGS